MPKFEVKVEQTEIREYTWTVDAKNAQEAEEKYYNGYPDEGVFIDAYDSDVVDVVEVL